MRVSLLLIFIRLAFFASGQTWTVYDQSNSSLPGNTVKAIVEGANGEMWFGTNAGLAHFDGTNWSIYNTSNSGLPDNDIRALALDESGRLWIGCFAGGLAMLDNGVWTVFTTANSDIPENQVKCLAVDSNFIWVGTIGGLGKYDGLSWKVFDDTIDSFNDLQLPSSNIADVAIRNDGLVCVGTVNGGFTYLTDSSVTVYSTSLTGLPDNTALGVALDPAGNRWVACPSGGLLNHAGAFDINVWFQYATASSAIPTNALNDVVVNGSDSVIVGTQVAGVAILESQVNWSVYNQANSGLPDNAVLTVAVDSANRIWCGTESGGVAVLDPFSAIYESEAQDKPYALRLDNGRLQLQMLHRGSARVILVSVLGKVLENKQVRGMSYIDLKKYASSLYVVSIEHQGLVYTERVSLP